MKRTKGERFNPRAREGRDIGDDGRTHAAQSFNPRAREGRDARPESPKASPNCFNPRAREGRDQGTLDFYPQVGVSIHAPVKGATFSAVAQNFELWFQSTRP